jgi:hypothetical protein
MYSGKIAVPPGGGGIVYYTRYFTSDNEPGEIENATHNTFPKLRVGFTMFT